MTEIMNNPSTRVNPSTGINSLDTSILQYLKTQFRLLQHNSESVSKRMAESNPRFARDFKVSAETWEAAAEIVEEFLDPSNVNDDGTYPLRSRNANLHGRMLLALETITLVGEPDV